MLAPFAEALVEPVDQIRHLLEPLGDDPQAVLAEVLGLDVERRRELADDVARRHRPVAVHEVVEVARRELRLRRERTVSDPVLGHQALEGLAERLLAEPPSPRHQRKLCSSPIGTRDSSAVLRERTSAESSSSVFLPTVTRTGIPIRSASANFSPARCARSSRRTSSPASSSLAATSWARSSRPGRAITCTSYGATERGHLIPCSSWCCSTIAAIVRAGPIP